MSWNNSVSPPVTLNLSNATSLGGSYTNNNNKYGGGGGNNRSTSASRRATSPSLGRQTAVTQAATKDWMRKTLMPVDGPTRVPEVFRDIEKHAHHHGNNNNGGGAGWRTRTLSSNSAAAIRPESFSHGQQRGEERHGATSPSNHHVLVSGAMRTRSPPTGSLFQRSWTANNNHDSNNNYHHHNNKNNYHSVSAGNSVSPHRTSHQHCVPMRSSSLARTTSPGNVRASSQSGLTERRSWVPRSASSSRHNTPRWNEPVVHTAMNANLSIMNEGGGGSGSTGRKHRSRSAVPYNAADAEVPLLARDSVSTFRQLQRSGNSTLPVCQTVGVDNSNCSCPNGEGEESGELMIQSIDVLLRANRGSGEMSPSRAKLVRSNSSPVANRVENIVKKEVSRRLQREKDRIAEEERMKEEMQRAREAEMNARHNAEVMRATAEAEKTRARLMAETAAREKAEAEKLAVTEQAARERAELESMKLRKQLEEYDSRHLSPGQSRIRQGIHPEGHATRVGALLSADQQQQQQQGGGAGSGLNNSNSNSISSSNNQNKQQQQKKREESPPNGFELLTSIRREAEEQTSNDGHFDPVSSKALQRVRAMRENAHRTGGTTPASANAPAAAASSVHFTGEAAASADANSAAAAAVAGGGAGRAGSGEKGSNNQQQQQQLPSSAFNSSVNSPYATGSARSGGGRSSVRSGGSADSRNRAEVASIVSQLASAGSSPLGDLQDEDYYSGTGNSSPYLSSPGVPREMGAQVVRAAASPSPTVFKSGAGGMMAPTVGMRDRNSHLAELMKRTQEKHSANANSVAAARARHQGFMESALSPSASRQSLSAQRHGFLDGGGGSNSQSRARSGGGEEEATPRQLFSAGEIRNQMSPGRTSQEKESVSPSRQSGPHYSPDSLVEQPMVAAPSGLWMNNQQQAARR